MEPNNAEIGLQEPQKNTKIKNLCLERLAHLSEKRQRLVRALRKNNVIICYSLLVATTLLLGTLAAPSIRHIWNPSHINAAEVDNNLEVPKIIKDNTVGLIRLDIDPQNPNNSQIMEAGSGIVIDCNPSNICTGITAGHVNSLFNQTSDSGGHFPAVQITRNDEWIGTQFAAIENGFEPSQGDVGFFWFRVNPESQIHGTGIDSLSVLDRNNLPSSLTIYTPKDTVTLLLKDVYKYEQHLFGLPSRYPEGTSGSPCLNPLGKIVGIASSYFGQPKGKYSISPKARFVCAPISPRVIQDYQNFRKNVFSNSH